MPLTARQKFGSLAWHYRIEAYDGDGIVTLLPETRMRWPDVLTLVAGLNGATYDPIWIFEGRLGGPQYQRRPDGSMTSTTSLERSAYWDRCYTSIRRRQA